MIRFNNITKKFKDTTVLSNISFNVEEGQLVVLIGLSGCGKTTTLKMINRLIKPTSGSILINGEDISKKDPIELRRNIGYVIQQTGLFPHMTIKENIEIISRIEKISEEKISKRTLELMEMIGLEEAFLERYPTELSGGQQQRVGVARAFALNPNIILMDEPFSALDPITRAQLQEELVSLQKTVKKTIVFVTHDMTEAMRIADKICIMDKGEIIQYDTPENILKNPANDFVSEFVGENRIWGSPEYIKARDIMIEHPITCGPDMSLSKCFEKMRISKVNSLMVIDPESKKMIGLIKAKQIAKEKDPSIAVTETMLKDFIVAKPEDSMIEILKVVNEDDISEIPVVDENRRLKGLITQSSLVNTLSQQYIDNNKAVV